MTDISSDDLEPLIPTLTQKLPFFILGIAIGMAVVWIAFLWIPGAMSQAVSALSG